ncbi:DUF2835 domain-containing protein [Nitrincola tibetensis]|uniref:DUF2835 domain-containing protein n=1 Tax=Nitrincola tibetensis TaxID=2219697 RepID=A0A364NKK6_9GAMM|nr:DUF2835 domain-containing protein [Nitrincola tibetensis]RAU17668.1 DUF2835 domain-containing protein [Nitrincola tibetensis]
MKYAVLDVKISRNEFLKYYKGVASRVSVRARDGRRFHLPASVFTRFLSHHGVNGSFIIYFSEEGKLIQIDRMSN